MARMGLVLPKKSLGVKDPMWSEMSSIIAAGGIDINIPGMPHKAPNASITVMGTNAMSGKQSKNLSPLNNSY